MENPRLDKVGRDYVAPYYHIHPKCLSDGQQRAHFHRIVYELAEPHLRITIRTQCRVVAMEPSLPTLTLESGGLADLGIGADGVRSLTRQYVVGGPNNPTPT